MQVVSFYNNKGGVAKTTSAVLIGQALATAGYPTLIIDNDHQGSASVDMLGCERNAPGIDAVLSDKESLANVAQQTAISDLWAVTPGAKIKRVAMELDFQGLIKERVKKLLAQIRSGEISEAFDFILFDQPPEEAGVSVYTSQLSDTIVIPVKAEDLAFKALLRTYVDMRHTYPHWTEQEIYILPTLVHQQRRNDKVYIDSMKRWQYAERMHYESVNPEKKFNMRVVSSYIPDCAEIQNMQLDPTKKNLFLQQFTSAPSKAYLGAIDEIFHHVVPGAIKEKISSIVADKKVQHFEAVLKPNQFAKKESV